MYRCLHTSIWHVDSSRHHHQKQQSDKSTPTQTSHCTAALHYSHRWQMPLSWIDLWFQSHRLQWRTWKSAYTVAAECKLQQTHCRQGGSISDTHERAQETHKHTLKLAPKSEQIHNFKRVNTGTHTHIYCKYMQAQTRTTTSGAQVNSRTDKMTGRWKGKCNFHNPCYQPTMPL